MYDLGFEHYYSKDLEIKKLKNEIKVLRELVKTFYIYSRTDDGSILEETIEALESYVEKYFPEMIEK